jgi:hypothetical protein
MITVTVIAVAATPQSSGRHQKGAGRDSNPPSPIPGGYALSPLRLPHGVLSAELPAPQQPYSG